MRSVGFQVRPLRSDWFQDTRFLRRDAVAGIELVESLSGAQQPSAAEAYTNFVERTGCALNDHQSWPSDSVAFLQKRPHRAWIVFD